MALPYRRECRSETSVKRDYKLRSETDISQKDERTVNCVPMHHLQTTAKPNRRQCRSETSVKHGYNLRSETDISLKDERTVNGVLMHTLQTFDMPDREFHLSKTVVQGTPINSYTLRRKPPAKLCKEASIAVAVVNKTDMMSVKSRARQKRSKGFMPSKDISKKQKHNLGNAIAATAVQNTNKASISRLTKQKDPSSEVVLEGTNDRLSELLTQSDIQSYPVADKHLADVPNVDVKTDTIEEKAMPVLSLTDEKYSADPVPGYLGTQKTVNILDVIKQEGRDSSKVKACLETILRSCERLFNDNDRVWLAYEPCNKDVPVLVAEVEKRINDAPEHASGCRLVQLVEEEEIASAAERYDDNERNKTPNFSERELIELRKCMDRNTDRLLKSHSNILAMIGSDKISHDKRKEIEDRTCVVIYVRTKRFIPFYEEQFTLGNNDCPLDVREGRGLALVSRLNPKEYVKALRMGCLIDTEYRYGTLTGFVELSDGKIACLTAWHIFDTGEGDHTAKLLTSDKFKKNVYQPCRSKDQEYKIGRVYNVSTDFDAALIEIDKPERLPRNGHFPNAVCPEKGFLFSKPMKFDSGNIINSHEEIELKKSCRVVKYGAETETTFGNIWGPCALFRLKLTNNRGYFLRSLICVCTELGKTFSAEGDSGSLVFLEDDETEELRAIGMIVGKLDSDMNDLTVVVPIWEILQSFHLPLRLLSFEEPWNIGLGVLQAHMKEVHQQLDQIYNVTKKTDETVSKYMQENTNQNR